MLHRLALLAEPLLRRLRPAAGRHRRSAMGPGRPAERIRVAPRQPAVLRGEDVALVRPYLVAHEQRRARRLVLWASLHGVPVGARPLHAVEAAA